MNETGKKGYEYQVSRGSFYYWIFTLDLLVKKFHRPQIVTKNQFKQIQVNEAYHMIIVLNHLDGANQVEKNTAIPSF